MATRKIITQRDSGLILYQWVGRTGNDAVFYPEYEIIDASSRRPLAKFDEGEKDVARAWLEGYECAIKNKADGVW